MALCVGAYSFNAASQSSLVSSLMPFSFAASWAHCEHMAVRPLRSGCTPGLAPTKTLRSSAYGELCAFGWRLDLACQSNGIGGRNHH